MISVSVKIKNTVNELRIMCVKNYNCCQMHGIKNMTMSIIESWYLLCVTTVTFLSSPKRYLSYLNFAMYVLLYMHAHIQ